MHDATLKHQWHGSEVRDGVGIDRQRASARSGALYNYEIVPAASEFSLLMELRDGDEKDQQLLALTLDALSQLPSAIGAKGNSGLGALKLEIEKVVTLDLTDRQTLFKLLCQEGAFDPFDLHEKGGDWNTWWAKVGKVTLKTGTECPPTWRIPQAITFTYRLKVKDPLLIRGREAPESALGDYRERKGLALGDDKGIDATWSGRGDHPAAPNWEPVIPGSSLRGVFRSHCERILRTLWFSYVNDDTRYKEKVKFCNGQQHVGHMGGRGRRRATAQRFGGGGQGSCRAITRPKLKCSTSSGQLQKK